MKKVVIVLAMVLTIGMLSGCGSSNGWVSVGDVKINKANIKVVTTVFNMSVSDMDRKNSLTVAEDLPLNYETLKIVTKKINSASFDIEHVSSSAVIFIDGEAMRLPGMDKLGIEFEDKQSLIDYTEAVVDMANPLL